MNIIKPLINFGHLHFGENKVQEASLKWTDTLVENKNLKLHMLGKIQSNKVDSIVKIFFQKSVSFRLHIKYNQYIRTNIYL